MSINTYTSDSHNARIKAEAIIVSCNTCEHFNYAKQYIKLYHSKYKDGDTFDYLMNLYKNHKKSNCYNE